MCAVQEVAQGAAFGAAFGIGSAVVIGIVGVLLIVLRNLKPLGWGLVAAAVLIGVYLFT